MVGIIHGKLTCFYSFYFQNFNPSVPIFRGICYVKETTIQRIRNIGLFCKQSFIHTQHQHILRLKICEKSWHDITMLPSKAITQSLFYSLFDFYKNLCIWKTSYEILSTLLILNLWLHQNCHQRFSVMAWMNLYYQHQDYQTFLQNNLSLNLFGYNRLQFSSLMLLMTRVAY